MARLACPVCRVALAPGQTHCPRCGLRVAALERHRYHREVAAAVPGPRRPPLSTRSAVVRGLGAGVALTLVCLAAGLAAHLTGHAGDAVAGNALLAVVGLCVVGSALGGGLRVARWWDPEGTRERSRARFTPARAALLGAAAAPLLAVALLAAAVR